MNAMKALTAVGLAVMMGAVVAGWDGGKKCTKKEDCSLKESCKKWNGSLVCVCDWEKGFKRDKQGECQPLCKEGYTPFGMKCYKVFNQSTTTWLKADMRCQQDNGTLAEPFDEKQSIYMYELLRGVATPAWLGGTADEEGRYMWDSIGYPLRGVHNPWTNWAPGQPDNMNEKTGRIDGCMELHGPDVECEACSKEHWAAGQWNDRPCDEKRFFICETALLL